jgi:hypothetical protein
MVDAGEAVALLGNHELNAIAYHTPDGQGGHLRKHTNANRRQHAATLDAFASHPAEWTGWVEWMKQLPLFFETDGLRAVHASWCDASIRRLEGTSLRDADFLQKATQEDTPEMRAVELLLKGPELDLKPYAITIDHPGDRVRDTLRVKWWDYQDRPYRLPEVALSLPPGTSLDPKPVDPRHLERIPNVALGGSPIFFGHYNLPLQGRAEPLAPGVCCLDYGAGRGGFLAAYRWDGEQDLDPQNFVLEPEDPA